MGTRSLYFLVVLTLLATLSCGKPERPLDPTLLWVPSHAKITLTPHLAVVMAAVELGFTLVDVDREQLTQQLVQHFEKIGWRQRSANHRTGYPTSFREGWKGFGGGGIIILDAHGRFLDPVSHSWHGEWENERGEVDDGRRLTDEISTCDRLSHWITPARSSNGTAGIHRVPAGRSTAKRASGFVRIEPEIAGRFVTIAPY